MNPFERKLNHEAKQCLRTHEHESWFHALRRFERLCHLDIYSPEDVGGDAAVLNLGARYDGGEIFVSSNKLPIARLHDFEEAHGIKVPLDLTSMLCEYGAFSIDATNGWRKTLCIYESGDPSIPCIKQYSAALSDHFTATTAGITEFSEDQLASLDSNYFFFGYLHEGDGDLDFLYFTREGHFGSLRYQEDFPEDTHEAIVQSMLTMQTRKQSLDSLMIAKIDRTIRILLERHEVVQPDEIIV